jgi:3-dehydroquinate dehydratase-1
LSGLVTRALEQGADLVEVRFDYLKEDIKPHRVGLELEGLLDQCVFTLRHREEGGHFQGGEDARRALLLSLSRLEPAYLDLELAVAESAPGFLNELKGVGTRLILSWHDFKATPSEAELLRRAEAAWRLGGVAKLVTTATSFEDNLRLLQLYRASRKHGLIAFCMGELGLPSRILAPLLGAPFTYARLEGEGTAPGQPTVKELRRLYALLPH